MVIPLDIRIYSPTTDMIKADHTVAFIIGRVAFSTATAQMDAFYLIPVPGDVDSDSYEDNIPDFPYPLLFGLGTVTGLHEHYFIMHVNQSISSYFELGHERPRQWR
jgi:hypothetical protein